MLKFFSINDVFRLLFVFLILLCVRLPFILMNDEIMALELSHLIIGQKMNEGMLMYKSIVDFTAPFSALVYYFIYWSFGRSYVSLEMFSLCLVACQAVMFNYWLNRLELLSNKTYFPSVLFVVIGSCTMEFQTLSPMMMATSFLMIALFKTLEVIKKGDISVFTYQSGIYLGIAILFYSPMVFFVLPLLLSLLAFSNIKPRKYIIYIYGVLFPLLFIGVFFMWKHAFTVYLDSIFSYLFSISKSTSMSLRGGFISFSILLLLAIFGLRKGVFSLRYISFQKRAVTVCLFVIVGFLFHLVFAIKLSYSLFYVLVPITSYFLSILFDLNNVSRKNELLFVFVIFFMGLGGYVPLFYRKPFMESLVIQAKSPLKGKVLILGHNLSLYTKDGVIPSTGFVNWELSKKYFVHGLKTSRGKVYTFIQRDTPRYIDDQEHVLDAFKGHKWFDDMYNQKDSNIYVMNN